MREMWIMLGEELSGFLGGVTGFIFGLWVGFWAATGAKTQPPLPYGHGTVTIGLLFYLPPRR